MQVYIRKGETENGDCNMISNFENQETPQEDLGELVRKFIDGDSFGTHPNVQHPMSFEDKRAL